MDAELQALRRAAEAEPANVDAARRYDSALLRADRRAEVEQRFIAKYVCPTRWEQAVGASSPRWCTRCEEEVQLTQGSEPSEFESARALGRGVAVRARTAELAGVIDWLINQPELHTAEEDQPLRVHLRVRDVPYLDELMLSDLLPDPVLKAAGLEAFQLGGLMQRRDDAWHVIEGLEDHLRRHLAFARRVLRPGRRAVQVLGWGSRRALRPPPDLPAEVLGWYAYDDDDLWEVLLDREGKLVDTSDREAWLEAFSATLTMRPADRT